MFFSKPTSFAMSCSLLLLTCHCSDQHENTAPTGTPTDAGSDEPYTLTIQLVGDGLGSVMSVPAGIDCSNDPEHEGVNDCEQFLPQDGVIELNAIPTPGSEFVGFEGDGPCLESALDSNRLLLTMTDHTQCSARFEQVLYQVRMHISGIGSILVQSDADDQAQECVNYCDYHFSELNENVTLTAVPGPYMAFQGWSGACSGLDEKIVLPLNRDYECTANFVKRELSIETQGTGNGKVTEVGNDSDQAIACDHGLGVAWPHEHDCTRATTSNENVTLLAEPRWDTYFKGWSGDCSGQDPGTTIVMDEPKHCMATFELKPTYPLEINRVGSDNIEPEVWIQKENGSFDSEYCADFPCVLEIPEGTRVMVETWDERKSCTKAVGFSGDCVALSKQSCISGWTTSDNDRCSLSEVTMDSPKTCTVSYVEMEKATVTVNTNANGTVTSRPDKIDCPYNLCRADFCTGFPLALAAAPKPGQRFDHWSGDCQGTQGIASTILGGPLDCTAHFTSSEITDAWSKRYRTPLDETASDVVENSRGGFVVIGYVQTKKAKKDLLIMDISLQGTVNWQLQYGGSEDDVGQAILESTQGNYIVVGSSRSYGAGNQDVWIMELSSNDGSVLWQQTYGGPGFDTAQAITSLDDNAYLVAGSTDSFGAGDKDVWVLKLDHTGDLLWSKTLGRTYEDQALDIRTTSDGGFVVAGFTTDPIREGHFDSSAWIVRVNAGGETLFQNKFDKIDRAQVVILTMDQGFLLGGTLSGEAAALVKLNAQGEVAWHKTYDNGIWPTVDIISDITQTPDGGYVTAGTHMHDGLEGGFAESMELTSEGDVVSATLYGLSGVILSGGHLHSVSATQDGGYVFAGFFKAAQMPEGFVDADMFLVKADESSQVTFGCSARASLEQQERTVVATETHAIWEFFDSVEMIETSAVPEAWQPMEITHCVRDDECQP